MVHRLLLDVHSVFFYWEEGKEEEVERCGGCVSRIERLIVVVIMMEMMAISVMKEGGRGKKEIIKEREREIEFAHY